MAQVNTFASASNVAHVHRVCTEYVQVQWDPIFQPDFNSPPKLKEIRRNQITSGRDRSHRQASQVGGTGLSRAGIIAGGWGRSLTGRHHRRWVGQVSHRQESSQVGGAGLSQAGFSANFDNPVRCVTYIQYIYIYIYTILV